MEWTDIVLLLCALMPTKTALAALASDSSALLLAIELRQSVCSTSFDHIPPQASLVRVGRI
jgi:hypothetical protein